MANILLIDDDPVLLKLYSTRLASDGHHVEIAINGQVALDTLKEFKAEVIVLDLLMPKLNGFAFLEQLNERPAFKNVPKIVFSSVVNDEQISRLKELGVTSHLNKTDTTPTQLVQIIQSYLPKT